MIMIMNMMMMMMMIIIIIVIIIIIIIVVVAIIIVNIFWIIAFMLMSQNSNSITHVWSVYKYIDDGEQCPFFTPQRLVAHRINVGLVDPCQKGIRLKTVFGRLRSAPFQATSIWLAPKETSCISMKNFPSSSL